MVTKKKSIAEQMKEDEIKQPITSLKIKEEFKPFLKEGYVFETENKTKWLINFNRILEIIMEFYHDYEIWFNRSFNNKDTHFLAIDELDTYTDNNPEIFESDK